MGATREREIVPAGVWGGSRGLWGGLGEGGDFIRQESRPMKTAQAPNNFEK